MNGTNLFSWATSELSQDAFICWLMSFAMKENHGKNPALESCAMDLLHRIPGLETASEVLCVKRQVYHIDVLLKVGDFYVIIEDKTFTGTREDQILRYKEALKSLEDIPPEKIKTVLYTLLIQPPQDVDCIFKLETLLEIMRPYKSSSNSDVFSYYVEHLEKTADDTDFTKHPISEWCGATYRAFFEHLRKEGLVSEDYEYGYVSNYGGGFTGVWWDFHGRKIDPPESYIEEVYMQIQKNSHGEDIVCVKINLPDGENDREKFKHARQKIFEYFLCIDGLQRRWSGKGKTETVCYITYDEKNYREQITKMQRVFDEMLKELRLP